MKGDEIWGYLSVASDRFSYAMPPFEDGSHGDTGGGLLAIWRDEGTVPFLLATSTAAGAG
jgi:hypothetical protein